MTATRRPRCRSPPGGFALGTVPRRSRTDHEPPAARTPEPWATGCVPLRGPPHPVAQGTGPIEQPKPPRTAEAPTSGLPTTSRGQSPSDRPTRPVRGLSRSGTPRPRAGTRGVPRRRRPSRGRTRSAGQATEQPAVPNRQDRLTAGVQPAPGQRYSPSPPSSATKSDSVQSPPAPGSSSASPGNAA